MNYTWRKTLHFLLPLPSPSTLNPPSLLSVLKYALKSSVNSCEKAYLSTRWVPFNAPQTPSLRRRLPTLRVCSSKKLLPSSANFCLSFFKSCIRPWWVWFVGMVFSSDHRKFLTRLVWANYEIEWYCFVGLKSCRKHLIFKNSSPFEQAQAFLWE